VTHQRDFVAAHQLLVEAVRLGRQLGNRWSVPYTIEGFGDIALAQNDAASAAQLYGAASVLRDLYGLSFSPSERTVYQGTLARMRAQLSPAIFEERWKEGNALRAQEALEFALTRTKVE
ncbi:MAG TPA: hypothetical protein VIT91_18275, partial [Chthoniobacterales bacterium]